ncbi:TATA binding protein of transcription factor TFIID [Haloplanus vescus]|uniref:TATA binding protein of transcription factor TFIID n=1 Tax=Haloplanus vescus TaxID=555874 RepID=A0A1H3YDR4_9EURY|nr:TATA-box-binding protein [Haloplanus vescus]SEA09745.1 TATA binding protein of transcription factor TFIID [Haloplanus vescus]
MVEVVNIVASGSLGVELDLEAIASDLDSIVDYDPEKYPGAYFRFGDSDPLITLYRTGKYIITGASSGEEVHTIREEFLSILSDHEILSSSEDKWFQSQNYVCLAEVGENLNLSALAIGLGLEVTEYEPEQFPGLVYRPTAHDCVLLVFGSGKVIMTGATSIETAKDAFVDLQKRIGELQI